MDKQFLPDPKRYPLVEMQQQMGILQGEGADDVPISLDSAGLDSSNAWTVFIRALMLDLVLFTVKI